MAVHEAVFELLTVRNAVLAFAAYVVYSCISQVIYYRFFHPLKDFPGPFWASVTRIWFGYHNYMQTELAACAAAHEKYGPVIRVTPTLLLVKDARKLPEIYHFKANKTPYYLTGSFGETESLFNMREHKTHARMRRLVAGPYSFSNVSKMESMMDERLDVWVNKMDENFASTGKVFDFCDWAVFMAYDIVSDFGFGAPFGFVEKGEDIGGLIQGFHDGMTAFGLMGRFYPATGLVKKTSIGKQMLVAKPGDATGIGTLMTFRDKLLAERLADIEAGKTPRKDLLQTFLEARDPDDGSPMDPEWIKAEILLVLLAGADTTGTAFQAVLHYLFRNPECYRKMIAEIDGATRKGKLSRIPQYAEVQEHCPYYCAVIKESMRLCPSAPNIFPRMVSEPGIELFGKFAPAGVEITCNPYFVARDKSLYGDDAEVFRPERWIEDPKEKVKEYDKYSFVFGYGARVCLGKDVALMEMAKGPLLFFQHFEPQLVDPNKTGEFIVHGGVGFWERINITIKKRKLIRRET